jgi:hypothetical protein
MTQPNTGIGVKTNINNYGQAIVPFQIDNLSIKEKTNYSWGFQLAQQVEQYVRGGTSNYFYLRNQQWKINRDYAHGTISVQKFMDLLEFNGKVNYINLNWSCIKIVNRIVSGLVGRWMVRNEKVMVTATDTLSTKEKQDQYEELEFIIANKRELEQLQAESGVQLIPQNQEIPEDQEELNLWQAQFQRLPEEILYELGINDVLGSNGWFDVLKEKMLHDSAECGFVGTYTWMDAEGVIHVEWLKPENCFYSYSNFPDFRDTTWRGYMRSMKVSELRKKYSKEFNPDNPHALDEEQLFQLAKSSKDYQLYDNLTWNTQWNVTYLRPYDEYNIDVMEFEFKTVDTESYTVVTTKKNKSSILKKGKPEKPADNEKVVEDSGINIYRGVYARTNQVMLEWGLKKNMIRPQDPKEIGNAEFSYSFYMVQNYDMTTLGVPQKIQEPADQMIIARLKMQQLVAKMRPTGALINWDALQNIDYGLGEGNKAIDVQKLYDQTGTLYYRSRDAEGNPIPVPITELANAGFLPQLQGLILLYDKHYAIMKDELGEDPNLISQALQPRVTAGNVETSQQTAAFATDQYYRAYAECMKDTGRKISCLLKRSVTFGAAAYRNIIGKNDVEGRIFSTKVQFLPDAFELQKFEAIMNQAIASTPDLIKFLDPFRLVRIAKEDLKLGETLFRQAQRKMLIHQEQMQRENLQMTIEGQQKSAQMAEQEKRATKEIEVDGDIKKSQVIAQANNQTAVLNMVASLLKPSGEGGAAGQIPPELKPVVNAVIDNIMVGAIAQTEQQKEMILQQLQAARMQEQQQQEEMQAQINQQQTQEPVPQPQIAA